MYVLSLSHARSRGYSSLDLQALMRIANHMRRGSYCKINARGPKAKQNSSAIRMLVRLVILHQCGRLTDNQWQAILALNSHKALIEQSEALDWAAINADIRLVKEVTKDEMSENDLEDLYWRVI